MTVTSILVFGSANEKIHSWAKGVQDQCKEWGVKLNGPITLPQVETLCENGNTWHSYRNIDDKDETWFDDVELSEEERRILYPETDERTKVPIFGRLLKLEDDSAVAKIFDNELDDELFLRVELEASHIQPSSGHQPAGYDPQKDYVTDIDYNSQHR